MWIFIPLVIFTTLALSVLGTSFHIISAIPSINITSSSIPSVKLAYGGHTYEMLPFVTVKNDELKKLNFPRLADEYKPVVQMPSDKTFTFKFAKIPREVNAFGIDYDADTTEVSPLTKIGKYQFSFGKLFGIRTLEVRAIYDDGTYATYTALVDIKGTVNELGQNLGNQLNPVTNQSANPDIFS